MYVPFKSIECDMLARKYGWCCGSSSIGESFVMKGGGMCVGEVYRFDGWDWIGDEVSGMSAG